MPNARPLFTYRGIPFVQPARHNRISVFFLYIQLTEFSVRNLETIVSHRTFAPENSKHHVSPIKKFKLMAKVKISIYQNRNKKSKNYKQFYGRVKHNSTIEPATLCAHAANDSGIEEAKVAIVFEGVLKQMKEQLCLGHPITLDGMGTFKIGISSEGVSTEDVQRRYPQFDPETDDIRRYLSARQVKSAHLLFNPSVEVKTLLRAIKFETDKTEWASLMAIEQSNTNTEEP